MKEIWILQRNNNVAPFHKFRCETCIRISRIFHIEEKNAVLKIIGTTTDGKEIIIHSFWIGTVHTHFHPIDDDDLFWSSYTDTSREIIGDISPMFQGLKGPEASTVAILYSCAEHCAAEIIQGITKTLRGEFEASIDFYESYKDILYKYDEETQKHEFPLYTVTTKTLNLSGNSTE